MGAAVEEVRDGFTFSEVDDGAGEVHGDGPVREPVGARIVGGGVEFGDGGFRIAPSEGDFAEGLVGEKDGVAVARMTGEALDELDESLRVRSSLIELASGIGAAESLRQGEEAVGFLWAGEEFGKRSGGEREAFSVGGGLRFRGEGLGLVRLAGGEFGHGGLTGFGGAVGAGGEGEEKDEENESILDHGQMTMV